MATPNDLKDFFDNLYLVFRVSVTGTVSQQEAQVGHVFGTEAVRVLLDPFFDLVKGIPHIFLQVLTLFILGFLSWAYVLFGLFSRIVVSLIEHCNVVWLTLLCLSDLHLLNVWQFKLSVGVVEVLRVIDKLLMIIDRSQQLIATDGRQVNVLVNMCGHQCLE
jgi:hypothetical protein